MLSGSAPRVHGQDRGSGGWEVGGGSAHESAAGTIGGEGGRMAGQKAELEASQL